MVALRAGWCVWPGVNRAQAAIGFTTTFPAGIRFGLSHLPADTAPAAKCRFLLM
jgi:hypothetical protein